MRQAHVLPLERVLVVPRAILHETVARPVARTLSVQHRASSPGRCPSTSASDMLLTRAHSLLPLSHTTTWSPALYLCSSAAPGCLAPLGVRGRCGMTRTFKTLCYDRCELCLDATAVDVEVLLVSLLAG